MRTTNMTKRLMPQPRTVDGELVVERIHYVVARHVATSVGKTILVGGVLTLGVAWATMGTLALASRLLAELFEVAFKASYEYVYGLIVD